MKPICPIFNEECLEQECSAFYVKSEQTYITAVGQGTYPREIITYDFCGMFNRKLPNKILTNEHQGEG